MELFGSQEESSDSLRHFPKWTGMLARLQGHMELLTATCQNQDSAGDCVASRWQGVIEAARGLPRREQLAYANEQLNRLEYVVDPVNWQREDYWATPYEFLVHDGDCEDYAIAKYMVLKALGMPARQMRIVVLNDQHLGILHSVLVVRHNEQNYILDNQIKQVVRDSFIRHYEPVYSINEEQWWRHLPMS